MTATQVDTKPADTQEKRTLSDMQQLARRIEQHHTAGLPGAEIPEGYSFPPSVITTLWVGIVGGGLLGALAGVLLQNGTLVISNIEGLYSMTPFTFHFFWLIAGVALGIVGAALATLFIPPPGDQVLPPEQVDVDAAATGNVLEVDLDDDAE